MTTQVISLEKNKFAIFMNILNIMARSCDDLVIKGGKICQMSNNRSHIIEIDLTAIVGDNDILISNIPQKEKSLAPFFKQNVDVDIVTTDEGDVRFQDDESAIQYKKPLESYLTNQFMAAPDLLSKLNIQDTGRIFSHKIEKYLLDRIVAWSEALQSTAIMIMFVDDTATVKITSSDTSETTSGKVMVVDDLECEINGFTSFTCVPFQLNIPYYETDVMFTNPDSQGTRSVVMKLSTYIDDDNLVPLKIWGLSALSD